MPPLKPRNQRLRRRQTDQRIRRKPGSRPLLRWALFNVPTGRRIDAQHRYARVSHARNDGGERLAYLTREAEPKHRVDDVVCVMERIGEIAREWDA
jgi:hypothetical protein